MIARVNYYSVLRRMRYALLSLGPLGMNFPRVARARSRMVRVGRAALEGVRRR